MTDKYVFDELESYHDAITNDVDPRILGTNPDLDTVRNNKNIIDLLGKAFTALQGESSTINLAETNAYYNWINSVDYALREGVLDGDGTGAEKNDRKEWISDNATTRISLKMGAMNAPLNPSFCFNENDDVCVPPQPPFIFESVVEHIGRLYKDRILSNRPVVYFTPGRLLVPTNPLGLMSKMNTKDIGDYVREESNTPAAFVSGVLGIGKHIISGLTSLLVDKTIYKFKPSYNMYRTYVNTILIEFLQMLGIKDDYFKEPAESDLDKDDSSIAKFVKSVLTTLYDPNKIPDLAALTDMGNILNSGNTLSDDALTKKEFYIPFVVEKGISVQDSFSTSTTEHPGFAKLNSMASEEGKKQMVGGMDLDKIMGMTSAEGAKGAVLDYGKTIAKQMVGANFGEVGYVLKGAGRFVFPQVWEDSTFSRSISLNIKLFSPYGDKMSLYQNVYVPLAMLIAMSLPRQVGRQSYTSPFCVKIHSPGLFNCNYAFIESMTISKGEDKNDMNHGLLYKSLNITLNIKELLGTMMVPINTSISELSGVSSSNDMFYNYLSALTNYPIEKRMNIFNAAKATYGKFIISMTQKLNPHTLARRMSQAIPFLPTLAQLGIIKTKVRSSLNNTTSVNKQ